jgi:D-aminopeptidase
MPHKPFVAATALLVAVFAAAQNTTPYARPRPSDLGLKVGILPTGPLDAITDVAGVEVGHTTIIRGDNIRTGVTAVLPHSGNLYREKVPSAIFVGNGVGKLAGSTQVDEMGSIETPILLTSTTSVPRAADALISYMLVLPGNEDVLSINPVVGETNDGYLNDIRGRHITPDDVFAAVKNAKGGRSSPGGRGRRGHRDGGLRLERRHRDLVATPACQSRGYTVGVLVQTNFGGVLTIAGAPVGQELGQYYLRKELQQASGGGGTGNDKADGSCMIVVATNAPLDALNLKRLAARAWLGIARTGSSASNGSGDYAIAFSTAPQVRIHANDKALTRNMEVMTNDAMSPLFLAAIEATEEAVYNSMFKATTMTGNGHTVEALPIEKTVEILKEHRVIK